MTSSDALLRKVRRIAAAAFPREIELPVRIYDDSGRVVYETPAQRVAYGCAYKEYVGPLDDGIEE